MDETAIAAATLIEKSASLLPKAWDAAKGILRKVSGQAQYDFGTAHNAYCIKVIQQFCRARTFFIRDQPQFIEDFYVPASIMVGRDRRKGKIVRKASLATLKGVGNRSVVTGGGGSGKTIFMRYLLLNAIDSGLSYPVFIELRSINDLDKFNLEELIFSFMKDNGFPLSEEFAKKSLKDGIVSILLDGFDEVIFSKRKSLEKQIKKLGSSYPCQIVVSSRPDMLLEGWDNFSSCEIAPLELDEACSLIEKINFDDDDEIKSNFIKKLKEGLFNSHRYFLSNPLLLSIMLMTYGDSADIPKKFASFYEQAYAALFQKHDALKSGYRRERSTDLDIFEFAKIFSGFSAITYSKRLFMFPLAEAIGYVSQTKRLVGMREFSAEGFLNDARQAVCLLVEDGLDLAFVHRSFQEYFVAKFICDASIDVQKSYIAKLSSKRQSHSIDVDNVLTLLWEMRPELVEENFLIPKLRDLYGKSYKKGLALQSWRRILKATLAKVMINRGGIVGFSIRNYEFTSLIFFVTRLCNKGGFLSSASRNIGSDDVGATQDISLGGLRVEDPAWGTLAKYGGAFSSDNLEKIRRFLVDIEGRAQDRRSAAGDVFHF